MPLLLTYINSEIMNRCAEIAGEPSVLVPGKGDIDHYGLTVTLGGDRGAYGKDRGSQVPDGGAQKTRSKPGFSD
jgi:hypothetical protein